MVNNINFKIMNFSEALLLMKQGKRIRRRQWDEYKHTAPYQWFELNDYKHVVDECNMYVELFEHEDVFANDWEVVE